MGHMAADVAVAAASIVPILVLGFILDVRFDGGLFGVVAFMVLAALWSLAFAAAATRSRSRPAPQQR
jgi:hypothetical protein